MQTGGQDKVHLRTSSRITVLNNRLQGCCGHLQDPGNHHLPGLGHLTWTLSSKMPSRWHSSCSCHNVLHASAASDPLRLCSVTKQDRHRLEGTIRTADRIPGVKPPSFQFLLSSRVRNRAENATTDPYLFSLLPSGGRYSSLYTCTTRHNSFTLQAFTLTNTWIYPPSFNCPAVKHINTYLFTILVQVRSGPPSLIWEIHVIVPEIFTALLCKVVINQ